jgi:hypothetical protein
MNATDKIFQDNSLGGKYNITGFYAHTFGTFYQSCGNCLNQAKRNATIEKSIALFGTRLGIISPNCMSHSYGSKYFIVRDPLQENLIGLTFPINFNHTCRNKNGLLTMSLRRRR